MFAAGGGPADVLRRKSLQNSGPGEMHRGHHGGGTAFPRHSLHYGCGPPVAQTQTAHFGRADRTQQAGVSQGINGELGEMTVLVDLDRVGRNRIGTDVFEDLEVVGCGGCHPSSCKSAGADHGRRLVYSLLEVADAKPSPNPPGRLSIQRRLMITIPLKSITREC